MYKDSNSKSLLGSDTVGQITGVTSLLPGPGLSTNIIAPDLVNVLWTNLQVPNTPVTRTDGDTVLLVDVLLVGDENDQTSINLLGDPGSFPEQVRREYSGNSIDQVPCLSGGTLLIDSPAMLEIAGNIRTPGGADIALVDVTLGRPYHHVYSRYADYCRGWKLQLLPGQ